MVRWILLGAVAIVALGAIEAAVARMLGTRASRISSLIAVVVQWLAAYVLWTFAGGLAVHYGLLSVYEPIFFVGLGIVAGIWHYQARVTAGRERGRVIFVGSQFLWLVILLLQNGAFRY
jgi:hypothetical protein